jgi:glycosyltransferase involved in cell wall biosynthesis
MRVKILNALAQGLPVVSTQIGCEGIAVKSGKHLMIADTPEAFARATLCLLENRNLSERLARNGRQLIKSTYDYRVACRPLDQVYGAA